VVLLLVWLDIRLIILKWQFRPFLSVVVADKKVSMVVVAVVVQMTLVIFIGRYILPIARYGMVYSIA